MKEKEIQKKKKQEKKGKLQAAAKPYATTTRSTGSETTTPTPTYSPTTRTRSSNDDSFAVGDRVMKVNSLIPYKRYVIVNYLTAITDDASQDKVIIRPIASFTPVYETVSVTKVVRYQKKELED